MPQQHLVPVRPSRNHNAAFIDRSSCVGNFGTFLMAVAPAARARVPLALIDYDWIGGTE